MMKIILWLGVREGSLELEQVTTPVQMSTHQKSCYLMEINPSQARNTGPLTLETVDRFW